MASNSLIHLCWPGRPMILDSIFLITFKNRKGGTNTFGVQVKGTESEVSYLFSIDKSFYGRLTLSDILGFLLVADVKRNLLYFGWPSRKHQQIKLGEINDETARQLKKQLIKTDSPKLSEVLVQGWDGI